MTDTTDRLVGQTIDERFRLERLLGTGGMGKVYYGIQLSVGRPVALKILRSELSELPSIQQRFFREAKVLAGLHHPNIVGLVDFGRDPERDALYLAMQFVDGRSLTQMLKAGRLPLAVALTIGRQICSGLAEAHAAGVIHRDLKPDNIMLQTTAEGAVVAKILDFGIALPTGKEETRFTSTGAIVGTPFYMSPEQAQDQPVGPYSDLYAVGVMLYEMIAGEVPFSGDTPLAVMFKMVNERHRSLHEIGDLPTVPGPLGQLIDDLLEKDPSRRPSSASQVARRLDELRSGLSVPSFESIDALETVAQPAVTPTPTPTPTPVATPAPGAHEVAHRTAEDQRMIETVNAGGGRNSLPIIIMALVVLAGVAVLTILVAAGIAVFWTMQPDSKDAPPGPVAQVPVTDTRATEAAQAEVVKPNAAAVAPATTKPRTTTKPTESTTSTVTAKPPTAAKPKPAPKQLSKRPGLRDNADSADACQRGTCKVNMTAKGSNFACQSDATCIVDCAAGDCRQVCQGEASCTFDCTGGGCAQVCFEGTTCRLSCRGGDCDRTNFNADVTELD